MTDDEAKTYLKDCFRRLVDEWPLEISDRTSVITSGVGRNFSIVVTELADGEEEEHC